MRDQKFKELDTYIMRVSHPGTFGDALRKGRTVVARDGSPQKRSVELSAVHRPRQGSSFEASITHDVLEVASSIHEQLTSSPGHPLTANDRKAILAQVDGFINKVGETHALKGLDALLDTFIVTGEDRDRSDHLLMFVAKRDPELAMQLLEKYGKTAKDATDGLTEAWALTRLTIADGHSHNIFSFLLTRSKGPNRCDDRILKLLKSLDGAISKSEKPGDKKSQNLTEKRRMILFRGIFQLKQPQTLSGKIGRDRFLWTVPIHLKFNRNRETVTLMKYLYDARDIHIMRKLQGFALDLGKKLLEKDCHS